jgi:hypothetical protein
MTTKTTWESGTTGNDVRISATIENGAVIVTLQRRAIFFRGEDQSPTTGLLLHSRLVVWWPNSVDEAMRLIGHWLDFYDQALKSGIAGLRDMLSKIPEMTPSAVPPQGTSLN